MVKVKEESHLLHDGSIDLHAWLHHLLQEHHYPDTQLIRSACLLSQLAGEDQATESGESCLQQGLAMAEILVDLQVDQQTIAAAIIYDSVHYAELTLDDVTEQLGTSIAKLVDGVERMNAIDKMHELKTHTIKHRSIDNMRKMLLAMADDVRVVLIKLAERLRVLRTIAHHDTSARQNIAREAMDIYAPLANRLGIGQIKWEMEDLAFRYLNNEQYKTIAKGLSARRIERDRYVKMIVQTLQTELKAIQLSQAKVYGRAKHIHSIYRKMQRKNVPLEEIYDATAVRVLVTNIDDCYQVISKVHELWQPISAEYDDYIVNPKSNGYRSLHTAVIGPEARVFEVQIRTQQMHEEAELGVAAHWKYKEGDHKLSRHEQKIEWLRQVLAWQQDVAHQEGIPQEVESEFIDDRVYVFTPDGEIIDLPQGATPLDFAYHIHSEVGHRCRGAKINDHIVPLIYQLQTGEQVEILTSKDPHPSRDWLNPNLGYIHTSRAKAKIHHWLKQQDFDQNLIEGERLLEREMKKLGLTQVDKQTLAQQFNLVAGDDLLAAIGCGDIRLGQLIHKLHGQLPKAEPSATALLKPRKTVKSSFSEDDVYIDGVGNLLTKMAKCCQPIPGDSIIGYITLGKGISIHRQDCANILNISHELENRLINVSWGEKVAHYPIDLMVEAYDRPGLLKEITALITHERTNLLALNSAVNPHDHIANIQLTVEVNDVANLSRLIDKIKQLPNILEVQRSK
ncbi:MAG: GTP diphosphokinase [Legionellales bacterium]|nr:GTP diphosphokinase [Legionellales bacterium]